MYDVMKGRFDETDCEPFAEMPELWITRGDVSDAGVKKGVEQGMVVMQAYLRKRIWPLPMGANADTLRQACQDGDSDMIEELIKLQIPVKGKDAFDIAGLSPIHYAARFGNAQPLRLLMEAQAEINVTGGALNETPLHCAAMHGRKEASTVLIKLKAEVGAKDRAAQSPLHHAALKGHVGACKVLLNGNADLEDTDTAGQTPLHLAAWHNKRDIVRYFIAVKCEIDTEDIRGQTAYDRAIEGGALECSDQLDIEQEKRIEEDYQRRLEEARRAGKDPKKVERIVKRRGSDADLEPPG